MFSKTAIALAVASFAVGAVALTPAMANYAPCLENPAGSGCPGEIKNMTSHQHKGAAHPTVPATRHHHG